MRAVKTVKTIKQNLKRAIPALVAGALLAATPAANAVQFSGVYIFGDSLSDAGYYRPGITALLGAPTANAVGKFTTNSGLVWSEIIAQYYGGVAKASNAGGGIYAQGGMRVSEPTPASLLGPGGTQRPVSTQIGEYLASSGRADPNALYGVWAGANDIFANLGALQAGLITPAQLQANVLGAAASEIQQIGRLKAAGAKYVMVFNVPDIGGTPEFASNPLSGTISALTAGYNTTLFAGLAQNNISVIPIDAFAVLKDITANAAAFGFSNTTARACNLTLTQGTSLFCSPAALVSANAASSYIYADGVHPTTGAHKIIADYARSLIDGPNSASMLAESPLRTRESHIRALDQGLRQGMNRAVGTVAVFAGADSGKYDVSTTNLNPATNTKYGSFAVGATMRASEAATVGVAAGNSTSKANMGDMGKFDTSENVLSAFAAIKMDGLYGNANLSVADVKFKNVQRGVQLGQVTRTASSSTNGSNASAAITVGYDFAPDDIRGLAIGPFANFTTQKVDVNGYSESGSGSADLKIGSQTRLSKVTSFGMRASYTMGMWTPYLRFSIDREGSTRARDITASPLVVTTGTSYTIPGVSGDTTWSTFTLGMNGKITDKIGLSVAYNKVGSKSNVKQDAISALIDFGF